jgi:predicted transcriptional regulator
MEYWPAMKVSEINDILKGTILCGEDRLDDIISGVGSTDLMEDVLSAATEGCVLLTGVVTEQVIRTAKVARVGAIVFVRGKQPSQNVIDLAKTYHLPILLTRYSLFVASGRLYMGGLRGLDGSW